MEFAVFALLALHGILCTAALVTLLLRAEQRRPPAPDGVDAPEKLEPPEDLEPPFEAVPGESSEVVFAIMAEFFPDEYGRYRAGGLGYAERRWAWEAACAIRDARVEIEEICS